MLSAYAVLRRLGHDARVPWGLLGHIPMSVYGCGVGWCLLIALPPPDHTEATASGVVDGAVRVPWGSAWASLDGLWHGLDLIQLCYKYPKAKCPSLKCHLMAAYHCSKGRLSE